MPNTLEQTWRWFGPADPIPLTHIRQAGATGIVTALHHIPCGEIWPIDEIQKRKSEIASAGMRWSVVESVAVHEDIKQRTGQFRQYIDSYRQTLSNLGRCGVRTVCYNFMAVTDWTRTSINMVLPSGARALRFDMTDAAVFDIYQLKRAGAHHDYAPAILTKAEKRWAAMPELEKAELAKTILLGLPGTVADLSIDEFRNRLAMYDGIDSEMLRSDHTAFLEEVIPAAEQAGVVLAIHPDDPPFPMFGLPRIAGDEGGLSRILNAVDSAANGITFCSGSLGGLGTNDLPGMLRRLGPRVNFLHLRSVRREDDGSFFEDDHLAETSNMTRIMREAIVLASQRNVPLPMRPDHGHLLASDIDWPRYYSGYSYIGRLKGLAELRGLEMGLRGAQEIF